MPSLTDLSASSLAPDVRIHPRVFPRVLMQEPPPSQAKQYLLRFCQIALVVAAFIAAFILLVRAFPPVQAGLQHNLVKEATSQVSTASVDSQKTSTTISRAEEWKRKEIEAVKERHRRDEAPMRLVIALIVVGLITVAYNLARR